MPREAKGCAASPSSQCQESGPDLVPSLNMVDLLNVKLSYERAVWIGVSRHLRPDAPVLLLKAVIWLRAVDEQRTSVLPLQREKPLPPFQFERPSDLPLSQKEAG
jgi:hypothetical protein